MPEPITNEVMNKLENVETATVGHLRHWGFVDPKVQALAHRKRVLGTAVTLALPAQDSTLLHHVLGNLKPGHVVMIDRLGDRRHACWGGGVTVAAHAAGATAAIIDGPVTDPLEIAEVGFPVWCRGVSPITTRIYGLGGLLNRPVCCGGAVVNPGDIVIADENGVLVISPDEVDEVAKYAMGKQSNGHAALENIRNGAKLGDLSGASRLVEEALQ